jgi:hypothetical protein
MDLRSAPPDWGAVTCSFVYIREMNAFDHDGGASPRFPCCRERASRRVYRRLRYRLAQRRPRHPMRSS